jgi:parallel beta-helix repeat protein
MTIRGAGDGTVLQATDNTFNLMHLPGRRGVTITDLRIRGAGADGRGGQGLTGFRVQGCTFQRLRIERCGSSDASGLFLHASRENRILDCHFEDNGRGLMLYQDSTHNVIERCTGHRNAKEMIFLTEGCADNTISGCVSDHDGSRAPAVAVAIHKSDRTTLLGCTIRRSGQEQGVEIAAGDDNVVADCIITESNWAGLHVVNAQRTVIAGNTIAGNRESGILLRSAGPPDEARPCNHCLIVDNLIADNNPSGRTLPERSWAGIEIQHGSFIRIERNRLRNNRSIGIYIAPGNTGTRISGNVIEGAHAALLVDHGAGTVSDLRPPG